MITRMLFDMPVPSPKRAKATITPEGARQRLLLEGMDCLPGQQDLFDEPPTFTKQATGNDAAELIEKARAIRGETNRPCAYCGRPTHVKYCSAHCMILDKMPHEQ